MQVNKILSISNNIITNFNIENKNKTAPINPQPYAKSSQDITAANNIAFHGIFNSVVSTDDKLEAAMGHLKDNRGLVIVGNSMNDFLFSFPTFQNRFDNLLLEDVYFIKNDFKGSFGIYKDNGNFKIFNCDISVSPKLFKDKIPKDIFAKYEYVGMFRPEEIKDGHKIYLEDVVDDKSQVINLNINPSKKPDIIFDKYVQKFNYLDNVNRIAFNNSRIKDIQNPQMSSQDANTNGTKVMFSDIGGQDKNIQKLKEEVIFPLKYPQFYEGIKQNRGVLLYGPPRCGKTLLALALANEAGVNFLKLGPHDLTRPHVGETEQNWRNVFAAAKEKQPCIIFIDEFENIAGTRKGSGENAIVKDDVVSQLLVSMSDLEKSNDQVYVVAATNRKDLIDPAMLNSGRFGLALEVKEPDMKGTIQIFNINKEKNKFIGDDVDVTDLCNLIYENQFNGANIVDIFSLAHKNAIKRSGILEKMQQEKITKEDLGNFKITQKDFISAIHELADMRDTDE